MTGIGAELAWAGRRFRWNFPITFWYGGDSYRETPLTEFAEADTACTGAASCWWFVRPSHQTAARRLARWVGPETLIAQVPGTAPFSGQPRGGFGRGDLISVEPLAS